jgi:hypothetical protein
MYRRWPSKSVVLLVVCIVALVLFAGCGVTTSQTPGGDTSSALPTATAGSVTIATNAHQYTAGATLTVTINNNGNQSIYAADHQSNCTVVQIQRMTGSTWSEVHKCAVLTATVMHEFGAHQSATVRLVGSPEAWPKGTYRAVFSHGATRDSAPAETAYSAAFQVA